MLVDANILLFAVDSTSRFHSAAKEWLEAALTGTRRVALPWEVLNAFLRIGTHPRASRKPMSVAEAWSFVDDWLSVDMVWTPLPTVRHADVLRSLMEAHDVRGALVSDAHLAALAVQHGLTICSADSDFARFTDVAWINPLAA